jgi:hypothetical protein
MKNKIALIITYWTDKEECQPPPCFSATLKLLEKLPVDVYILGGIYKWKEKYYKSSNSTYVNVSLREHVERLRTLSLKYLNTDIIEDQRKLYRYGKLNGWYCLHMNPMLLEAYPEILSNYEYWGQIQIDILLNYTTIPYFNKLIEEKYDTLNCGSWTGSFRVIKNDYTLNTLWRNVELKTDIKTFHESAKKYEDDTGKNCHSYGTYDECSKDGYVRWLIENKRNLFIDGSNAVYCSTHFRAYGGNFKFTYENGELFGYKDTSLTKKVPINYWNADTYIKFNGSFDNEYMEEYAMTEDQYVEKRLYWEKHGKPRY